MNNNIQENKRSIRFSVADFVIIIMVFACLIGALLRYDVVENLFTKSVAKEYTVTFLAESLTENEAIAITDGASFFLGSETLGELKTFDVTNSVSYYEDNSGAYASFVNQDKFDVRGKMECNLVDSENGYLLGGKTYIAPGSTFTVKEKEIEISILILSIDDISETKQPLS